MLVIALGEDYNIFLIFLIFLMTRTLGRWNWWPTKPKDNGTYK